MAFRILRWLDRILNHWLMNYQQAALHTCRSVALMGKVWGRGGWVVVQTFWKLWHRFDYWLHEPTRKLKTRANFQAQNSSFNVRAFWAHSFVQNLAILWKNINYTLNLNTSHDPRKNLINSPVISDKFWKANWIVVTILKWHSQKIWQG